ncbi:MAG: Cbb3-type cytochrome oxidase component FixQ [Pseudomonadota bacterium]|jgi:cytochrome c oxidase cbb3-type subunit 4
MDFHFLSSLFTVLSLLTFLGIWYWAFSGRNKARFDALAYLPLEPDEVMLSPGEVSPVQTNSQTGV